MYEKTCCIFWCWIFIGSSMMEVPNLYLHGTSLDITCLYLSNKKWFALNQSFQDLDIAVFDLEVFRFHLYRKVKLFHLVVSCFMVVLLRFFAWCCIARCCDSSEPKIIKLWALIRKWWRFRFILYVWPQWSVLAGLSGLSDWSNHSLDLVHPVAGSHYFWAGIRPEVARFARVQYFLGRTNWLEWSG
jgi:hypothetical protein